MLIIVIIILWKIQVQTFLNFNQNHLPVYHLQYLKTILTINMLKYHNDFYILTYIRMIM